MSVHEHLEAAWKASLLEPQDEATAHIIWSIGRYLGTDAMARLTSDAMNHNGDYESVVERLEEVADNPLRVEVYEQRLLRLHDDRDDEPFTEYRFRVVHTSNGEILAHGEGYVDKRDRDHAVALLHPDLDVVEVEG